MPKIACFDFFPLQYGENGNLRNATQLTQLTEAAASATDVILLAHGFCNDERNATDLYTRFLTSLCEHFERPELRSLAARKFIAAGVFWPSKAFPDTFGIEAGTVQDVDSKTAQIEAAKAALRELRTGVSVAGKTAIDKAIRLLPKLERDVAAQDQFVKLVLSIVAPQKDDPLEGMDVIRSKPGSEVLDMMKYPVIPVASVPSQVDACGGVDSFEMGTTTTGQGCVEGVGSFFGSILGAAGKFANMTTWYQMKSRSGIVGETGVGRAVRALKKDPLKVKVHLVGHSLGGRLMAACSRALSQDPVVHPDSMTLLEAAFSHFGFSPNNGKGKKGFFRDAIAKHVVTGPLLETFSEQDSVVGYAYALASRLAQQDTSATGDANDVYGGIGRNGAQKTPESVVERLHDAGMLYTFKTGVVTNLDGSNGLITSHSDVTNERVTYAVASAVAIT